MLTGREEKEDKVNTCDCSDILKEAEQNRENLQKRTVLLCETCIKLDYRTV